MNSLRIFVIPSSVLTYTWYKSPKKKEEGEKEIWRNNEQKLPKTDEKPPTYPRNQINTTKDKFREIHT